MEHPFSQTIHEYKFGLMTRLQSRHIIPKLWTASKFGNVQQITTWSIHSSTLLTTTTAKCIWEIPTIIFHKCCTLELNKFLSCNPWETINLSKSLRASQLPFGSDGVRDQHSDFYKWTFRATWNSRHEEMKFWWESRFCFRLSELGNEFS